jgi:hypothetical protein
MHRVGEGMERTGQVLMSMADEFSAEVRGFFGSFPIPQSDEEKEAYAGILRMTAKDATDELCQTPISSSEIHSEAVETYKKWRNDPKSRIRCRQGEQPGETPRGESDSLQSGN